MTTSANHHLIQPASSVVEKLKLLIRHGEKMTEDSQHITKTPSLDYDLYVIDPNNKDTTPEQLRDCIYDALKVLDERTRECQTKELE